jgi:hypothetical protein
MTRNRWFEWLLVALTAVLMVSLKYLHYGVTHYNVFLLILMAWSMIIIVSLRWLHKKGSIDPD